MNDESESQQESESQHASEFPHESDLFQPPAVLNDTDAVAAVLGGGGSRGLAHLGVIHRLATMRLDLRRVVGVSIGSLMAGLLASTRDVRDAESLARDYLASPDYARLQRQVLRVAGASTRDLTNRPSLTAKIRRLMAARSALVSAVRQPALLPESVPRRIVDALIPDVQIEDLRLPLAIVMVDLKSGRRIVQREGSLREAVLASMSIPGVFPPLQRGDQLLADIGVYDAVPCDVARGWMPADEKLIAVDVSRATPSMARCRNAFESVLRFQELAEQRIRMQQLSLADIVVRPECGIVPWFDFGEAEKLIAAGHAAAWQTPAESMQCNLGDGLGKVVTTG
ncbi:MAG: patatin-like phospholipase family protein [Planctomycetota bacterium]